MHVLVTTDTLSGVWTYTRELVTGLISRGARVTLVSFGDIPGPSERLDGQIAAIGISPYGFSFGLDAGRSGGF